MFNTIIIVALTVLFIHVTTWEGMINAWVGNLCYNWPDWIKKPLYDCPICMCPWWGSIVLWLLGMQFGWDWIIIVFAAGGLNTVFIYLIEMGKDD